ncbi:MAG: hypothetical protein O3C54_06195 [Proteobacteria bacterium]|nr:hypothetical protein [Pseudomonadota bacterium]
MKEFSADEYGGEEMFVDFMLDNFELGAAVRAISVSGVFSTYDLTGSVWGGTFEVQDPEYGNMTTSVDMFLSLNGGSEVLYQTFNPSEMTRDELSGLPQFQVQLSFGSAVSALGNPSYTGGDNIGVRFAVNLNDGRTISSESKTGYMTQIYFNSPFEYNLPINCFLQGVALPGSYRIEGQDSFGDGWNGGSIDVLVDGANIGNFTIEDGASGTSETYIVPSSASSMDFVWNAGSWDSEVTFQIYYTDASGNESLFHSDGPSMAAGSLGLVFCQ